MEKALEFYNQLVNVLAVDRLYEQSTLSWECFDQTLRQNTDTLGAVIESHQLESSSCTDPNQKSNDDTTMAFSVLIKNKRRAQEDRAVIISDLEYYSLGGVDSSKVTSSTIK